MNYSEAREYLDKVSVSGSILGLDSIRALMKELGNPQDKLRIIHIAGTNGKGSILSYTRSILMAAGYSAGCYSSPSVFGYLERFQINGEWMKESELPNLVKKVKKAADRMTAKGLAHPTVFELETAIAFLYFYERGCDYVVLETGMGGDLDSTNVISHPLVCAFASISMDHIGVLGNTLTEIATCKSGIIKPGASVVTENQKPEVMAVLEMAASEKGCRFVRTEEARLQESSLNGQHFVYNKKIYKINLLGRHQLRNAAAAIEIAAELRRYGADITDEAVERGLAETRWPGRLEIISDDEETWVLDGAHNEDAAECLAETLKEFWPGEKFTAVMGVFKDKEYEKLAEILAPAIGHVICVDLPNSGRSLPKEELAEVFRGLGVSADTSDGISEAVRASDDKLTLITGSLSLLEEARREITEISAK